MRGTITTYLPEKKYGFIKGADGRDYFFHEDEFRDRSERTKLCEQAFVDFDQQATPKGYKAKNCSLVNAAAEVTYVTPEDFIDSRSASVRGWDILERGEWIVHASSRDSPDDAREEAIDRARQLGANALLELTYYKETGEESGTGRGTHHFTIHNFRGRITVLGKKSAIGRLKVDQLRGLNARAASLKHTLVARTRLSKRKRNIIWISVLVLSLFSLASMPPVALVLIVLGFIFGRSTDYDSWLERG